MWVVIPSSIGYNKHLKHQKTIGMVGGCSPANHSLHVARPHMDRVEPRGGGGGRHLGFGCQPPPELTVGRRPPWGGGGGIWGVHAPKAKRWSITGSPPWGGGVSKIGCPD